VTFYVVPVYIFVLVALAILALIMGIIFVPRMVSNYNKRVIRRASRRR
jgi:hypothetical protein